MVMIGIDPHKRTHTAVAVDEHETVIGERLVHARVDQVGELVAWADELDDATRTWAVESAGGLGYLLSQQLIAAGECVVDVPATLASRVRLLGTWLMTSPATTSNARHPTSGSGPRSRRRARR
jgi:transposase